jgi:hypothetical protein
MKLAPIAVALTVWTAAAGNTAGARTPRATHASPGPCRAGPMQASACSVLRHFFAAIRERRDAEACNLLGLRLLSNTGGANCPRLLSNGLSTHGFAILGVRPTPDGEGVLTKLDVHELDHWRPLHWLAIVGPEDGTMKILDTRRVA